MATAPLRILAVAENPDTSIALNTLVRTALPGAALATACTGSQAIALALAADPDVIVLDSGMAAVDGCDLCRQFKTDALLGDIPVLVLTAPHTALTSRVAALEAGADGFLAMPLDEPELIAQIRAMAKIKGANRRQGSGRAGVEDALQKSEARLKSAERIAQIGHYEIDIAAGTAFWSEEVFRIFGMDPSSPPPTVETYAQLIHPDDRTMLYQMFEQSSSEGKLFDLEYGILRANGETRTIRSIARVTQDLQGHGVMFGTIQDITEYKQAEAALRESEARYRSLLELAPIGIAVHSEGKIVFANPAAARLLGADSPAQLAGKPVSEIIRPDHWPATLARIPHLMAGEQGLYPVEDVYLRLDGTPIDVEVIVTSLAFQGKPAVQVIVLDITERKRAEAERASLLTQVQTQAQQIAQILDTVPQGVILLDGDGRVLLANPTGVRDLAVLADAAVGARLTRLGTLPLAALLASAPGGPWHEIRAGERIFEAIARPIVATQPDQAPGHWVVVIDNVTYQRAVREQLQQQERLAAVGQLAAGIAHDFNNILAIIALQASMAARAHDLAVRERDRLTIISEQTANAAALIQQILDFSRRAVLERRPLDLLPLLKEQVNLLTRTLPENIQVSLVCEADEYVVLADPTRIQQMVMNLAVNARDAMPQGGSLCLTLAHQANSLQPDLPAGPWLRLTIADTGVGIPDEALAHIFEPFFTTKPHGRGTGLGLAQVYGIVKQHAGEIDVHSVTGQGATFTIYLPALAQAAPAVAVAASEPARGNGATILLVEDNAKLLEVMTDVIEILGYTVVGARNGIEALAVLEERRRAIALVLTDLVMPQMGGDALLTAIRARGLTTPVVILSGHPLESELAGLKARGVSGWLLKPPKMRDLAQMVAQALAE